MNRELLEKPFAPEQIKQRKGTYGNVLDYVEGHAVIQRLNDAFDANWSFEILEHEILEDKGEVIVLGKLTAEDVVKTQFFTGAFMEKIYKPSMRATEDAPESDKIYTKRKKGN